MPRPSGLPIVENGPVTVAVAHVEKRGRINILPRWREKVEWLSTADTDVTALMTFSEPGLISITDWTTNGPRIQARFAEIWRSADADALVALRLIQDRYQRLIIPAKDRPSLGDSALAHLDLRIERGSKSVVYVSVFPDHIEIMSQGYRDSKLVEGHVLIEDLP